MSNDANKKLVLAFYRRVIGEGHLNEAADYIGETYLDHNAAPDSPRGPAAVVLHMNGIRATFPDFELRVHEVIADSDWVATRVTAHGTHLGEWLNIEPTGRRVTLKGINLDRVSGDRIVEHWGEADTVGMLVQMGLNPFGSAS